LPKGLTATKLKLLSDTPTPASGAGKEGGGGGGGGNGVIELGGFRVTAVAGDRVLVYFLTVGMLFLAGGIKRVGSFEFAKDRYALKKKKAARP
jgi:hypothetical protein